MYAYFLLLSAKSCKIKQMGSAFNKTRRFFNKNFLAVYVRAFKKKRNSVVLKKIDYVNRVFFFNGGEF